LLETEHKFDHF